MPVTSAASQQPATPATDASAEPDVKRQRVAAADEDESNPQLEGEALLAAAHDAASDESDALALVFQPYFPRRVTAAKMGGPVGTAHPETIVEAASMASVCPPEPSYLPRLDESLLLPTSEGGTSGLSDVQYESVVYAGQAHQGTCQPVAGLVCTRGFYIGDGTGVGKGRQVAGVILDNWMQGRRRAVWVSISADLLYDCRRDLKDLFDSVSTEVPVYPLHKLPYGPLDEEDGVADGVLFASYSALISANKTGERRLDQIVQWAAQGEDPSMFSGVIALDECHKAKHAATDGRLKPTKTGEAVIELQRRLPRAKLLYVSATAASEVKDMAYMERLGLWGSGGAPFASFGEFTAEMSSGGMCAMELLAMDLKARGLLVSRMLAFTGCTYEVVTASLTAAQRALYDSAAELWGRVLDLFDAAFAKNDGCPYSSGGGGNASGGSNAKHVWGSHQQFFRQLLNSLKATHVIVQTEAALAAGYSVVLGLMSTGAARMADAEARAAGGGAGADALGGTQMEAVSAPAEILRTLLEKHLPVNGDGELAARRDALIAELESLGMPPTALDIVVSHFGPDRVAEMTGRKRRLILGANGSARTETRAKPNVPLDQVNLHERSAFMRGEKRVAIISEAASAGISLHADLAFANTQPRMHITMELAWSAEKQLQQFGRTHRARQAQPPHYKLLVSDVGGEARFAATIAKRLAVLGAITRGDRRGASGASFARFDYDQPHGQRALELLFLAIGDAALEHRLWERFRNFFEAKAAQARAQAQQAAQQAAAQQAANAAAAAAAPGPAAAAAVVSDAARSVLPLRILCRLALARSLEQVSALKGRLGEADLQAVLHLRANAERQRTSHSLGRLQAIVRLVPPSDGGPLVSQRFFDEASGWLVQMRLVDGSSGYVPEGPERKNVTKFLNRMLGLPFAAQRALLDTYAALLAALRGYEKVRGAADDGPSTLVAERIRQRNGPSGEAVHVDAASGAATVLYELECDTGVSWTAALRQYDELKALDKLEPLVPLEGRAAGGKGGGKGALLPAGFYQQRRTARIALAVPLGAAAAASGRRLPRAYKLTRPYHQARRPAAKANGGEGGGERRAGAPTAAHVHASELRDKWLPVGLHEAATLWQTEHAAHSAERMEVVWLISGSLMPIYSAVQRALLAGKPMRLSAGADGRNGGGKSELRVRRALIGGSADVAAGIADGHAIVGIQLDRAAKDALLAELKARNSPARAPAFAPSGSAAAIGWSSMLQRHGAVGSAAAGTLAQLPPSAAAAAAAARVRQPQASPLGSALPADFSQRDDDDDDDGDEEGGAFGAPAGTGALPQHHHLQQLQQQQQSGGGTHGSGSHPPGYQAEMAELQRMLSQGGARPPAGLAPLMTGGLLFGGQPLSRHPSFGCAAAPPVGAGWSPAAPPQSIAPLHSYPSAMTAAMLAARHGVPTQAGGAQAAAQQPSFTDDASGSGSEDELFDLVG